MMLYYFFIFAIRSRVGLWCIFRKLTQILIFVVGSANFRKHAPRGSVDRVYSLTLRTVPANNSKNTTRKRSRAL